MRRGMAAVGLVLAMGCSKANGLYDPASDELADDELADGAGSGEELPDSEPGSPGGADIPEPSDGTGGSDDDDGSGGSEPVDPGPADDDGLLLYASLDTIYTMPELGAGPSSTGDELPQLVPGVDGMALQFTSNQQWLAVPQHDGERINVDHRRGRMELDVRVDRERPHFEPLDLVSLSGVIPDGGGVRVGISDLFGGNRLWVQYIDAEGSGDLTRFSADALPRGEWTHLTLTWDSEVEDGEPNVELWIDDEPVEPLSGFASGPKEVGDASPEDVIVLGSWSLGGGYSAQATFDELVIYDSP